MSDWTTSQSLALVQSKIIRRAEVSRLARVLQGRLKLASYKTRNGLQTLPLDSIEPKLDEQIQLKRKRRPDDSTPNSSPNSVQNGSFYSEADIDWVKPQGNSRLRGGNGRIRATPKRNGVDMASSDSALLHTQSTHKSRKRTRGEVESEFLPPPSAKRRGSNAPASSPGYDYSRRTIKSHSFNTSLISRPIHENDENEIIPPSEERPRTPDFHSSPPTTPTRKTNSTDDGAGLLLYFAGSPLRETTRNRLPPMTPPTARASLPSAVMRTPVPQTPSSFPFNLSEFCNITPSPMPAKKRSSLGRGTPAAAKGLTFDSPRTTMTPRRAAAKALDFGKEITVPSRT